MLRAGERLEAERYLLAVQAALSPHAPEATSLLIETLEEASERPEALALRRLGEYAASWADLKTRYRARRGGPEGKVS